ncbi:hypothetical protein JKF63_03275 [Porcisia hertigi]|uniref:Polyprenol reductase n=1 Tax=Porcisia hertigi TaxID=2761500 RepID=A0A836HKB9_9TRYP|nr:hypothetical protein JKF63_03275 [Porcisia hertigi]
MESLSNVFAAVTASSFALSGSLMLVAALVLFLAAHYNDNYSWVDRSWSILPVVYTWIHIYYTHHSAREAPLNPAESQVSIPLRCSTLFGLVITLWGCRLTFNFFRRGGYARGGEDYRWSYVRTYPIFSRSPMTWTLFNFFFISLFQTWLIWAIALPVAQFPGRPATAKDVALALVLLALIALETICDEQQWRFQCAKSRTPRKVPYCYGFCVTGVFGYSRHLNVFCEASLWVVLAVAAHICGTTPMASWQWCGCIILELLTIHSTRTVTEYLSARKYPGYAVYQSITPMLFPCLYSTTDEVLLALESKKLS